jgi:CDGSH-type Zn-finger protein
MSAMEKPLITIMPTGPIIVPAGACDIKDPEGNKIDTGDRPNVALCRCGKSANSPLCDGTHGREGWAPAPKS